ncbi:NADPH-dependent FMN reductase [Shewanella sp. NIFS-20-20]|uniref:NADPH-dependent FMN reductase n=1 Tax=Shewanella sp. NIFS-20-20 TaxID=2853806 RepID=UPI001C44D395|nr:NAD(P)H-dependent oxidoreductase [Shewanella sp. NIFS-20-20]MBV7314534.1 NAD(P)H-dependent oxidoreductase [Shewanella sp. NIFS-20-20]
MKIIAFGASTSRHSINKQLANYAANLVAGAEVEVLELNDFELPLFSEDKEKELGQPDAAKAFYAKLGSCDAIVVSFAEHNGSYSAAYKNLFDWTSRIDMKVFQSKPMVLLATSPGPGGAASVLAAAVNSMPYFGGDIKAQLSLPAFYDNFDVGSGQIIAPEWQDKVKAAMAQLA